MKASILKSLLVILGVFFGSSIILTQTKTSKDVGSDIFVPMGTLKPQVFSSEFLDVNNISGIFNNCGIFYTNTDVTGPGFEWIKGSNKFAIFSAGLWVGAKFIEDDSRSNIRVASAWYYISKSSYRPGLINPLTHEIDDYYDQKYKVYKVQPLIENPDVIDWPIEQGAPWIDINNDGKYDPYIDKIGIKLHNGYTIPDMILFCVYSDSWFRLHTPSPLFVEIKQTAWAYKAIPNVHFIRFQIYNRSNNYWDSTYIGLWSDPDLGDAFDDYAGCDIGLDQNGKSHQLGYCYNGYDTDTDYGANPPAVGFKLLQGPAVAGSPNDSATYFDRKLYGYKNLTMSSFLFHCNVGIGGCSEKYSIYPVYPEDYYKLLKGFRVYNEWFLKNGKCDPKFELTGDPLSDTGCVQSDLLPPTDIRYFMNVGPFTVAPGDSQDIIYAAIIEQGTDRFNSITKLRKTSSELRYLFDNGMHRVVNKVDVEKKLISEDSIKIKLTMLVSDADQVFAKLYRKEDNFELNLELYDDGVNDDGIANNKVYGTNVILPQHPIPVELALSVKYFDNTIVNYEPVQKISVAGNLKIYSLNIIKENLIPDKKFNPGENTRCIFSFVNQTKFRLGNFVFNVVPLSENVFKDRTLQIRNFRPYISSNEIGIIDSSHFIDIAINPDVTDKSKAKIEFFILDTLGNSWKDTIEIEVHKNLFPIQELSSTLSYGEAEGAFGLRIIYPEDIKNNQYNIEVKKQDDSLFFDLINTSTLDTVLFNHELPDFFGFNIPVTDGFRLTRGTITTMKGLKRWDYTPKENIWFTGVKGYYTDLFFKYNIGFIAYPTGNNFISMPSGLPIDSLKFVEIHFDRNNFQKAYRYISGFAPFPLIMRRVKHPEFRPFVKDSIGYGWIYQDYEKYRLGIVDSGYVIPFTVWQVDIKGNKIRQLDVAIIERNDSLYRWKKISPTDSIKEFIYYGNVDGRWNPSPECYYDNNIISGRDGDEFIIIFNSTYSDTSKPEYCVKSLKSVFHQLPVMYAVLMRRLNSESDFKDGDVLKIFPYYPLKEGVVYSFNPAELKEQIIPSYFRLSQNYPNPFNAGTSIQYGLHEPGQVHLEIYNILGQKIKTLIDNQYHNEGNYTVFWDGTNYNNKPVASGIYFYRIQMSSKNANFAQTKKMVVVR